MKKKKQKQLLLWLSFFMTERKEGHQNTKEKQNFAGKLHKFAGKRCINYIIVYIIAPSFLLP